jgi:hypothetical protein
MKITGKMFSLMMALLFITSLGFVSCNNDDDSPSEHDIFVGKYDGFVSYSNGESNTEDSEGNVEVVKVGDNYNFLFSNGIPDITGVEFETDGETLINVGNTETQYIRVTAHSLDILYTENENDVWTADCTR